MMRLLWLLPSLALTLTAGASSITATVSASASWIARPTHSPLPCKFTLEQDKTHAVLEYDLCPLLSHHAEKNIYLKTVEDTPPTRTTNLYTIALGKPITRERDDKVPPELQCPDGTWICLIVRNSRLSRPEEPSQVLQVVPIALTFGLQLKGYLGYQKEGDVHPPLYVSLHGGTWAHHPQEAVFHFYCDHNSKETAAPAFHWRFNNTHAFQWQTRHACPKVVKKPNSHPAAPEPDTPAVEPPDTWLPRPGTDHEHPSLSRFVPFSRFMLGLVLMTAALYFGRHAWFSSRLRRLVKRNSGSHAGYNSNFYQPAFINAELDTEVVPLSPTAQFHSHANERAPDGKGYGTVDRS